MRSPDSILSRYLIRVSGERWHNVHLRGDRAATTSALGGNRDRGPAIFVGLRCLGLSSSSRSCLGWGSAVGPRRPAAVIAWSSGNTSATGSTTGSTSSTRSTVLGRCRPPVSTLSGPRLRLATGSTGLPGLARADGHLLLAVLSGGRGRCSSSLASSVLSLLWLRSFGCLLCLFLRSGLRGVLGSLLGSFFRGGLLSGLLGGRLLCETTLLLELLLGLLLFLYGSEALFFYLTLASCSVDRTGGAERACFRVGGCGSGRGNSGLLRDCALGKVEFGPAASKSGGRTARGGRRSLASWSGMRLGPGWGIRAHVAPPLVVLLSRGWCALRPRRTRAFKSRLTGLATLTRAPCWRCVAVHEGFAAIVGSGTRSIPGAASSALWLRKRGQRASPLPVAEVPHLTIIHRLTGSSSFAVLGATGALRSGDGGKRTFPLPAGVAQIATGVKSSVPAFLGYTYVSSCTSGTAAEGTYVDQQP